MAHIDMRTPGTVIPGHFADVLNELVNIMGTIEATTTFGRVVIDERDALIDAGIMNSLKYRRMLIEEFVTGKSIEQQVAFFFLTVLCGSVKAVDRMRNAIRVIHSPQLRNDCVAILTRMVKYNANKTAAVKFSGHNMAAAFPEMSMLGKAIVSNPDTEVVVPNYVRFDREEARDDDTKEVPATTVRVPSILALMQAGQLALHHDTQEIHQKWEKNFWLNVVDSGSARFANSFNPRFYDNKAGDQYQIPEMFGIPPPAVPYTVDELIAWHRAIHTVVHAAGARRAP